MSDYATEMMEATTGNPVEAAAAPRGTEGADMTPDTLTDIEAAYNEHMAKGDKASPDVIAILKNPANAMAVMHLQQSAGAPQVSEYMFGQNMGGTNGKQE